MKKLLETDRLIVREWEPDQDVDFALAIYGDWEVARWLGANPQPMTDREALRQRLHFRLNEMHAANDGTGFWPLEEKDTGDVVGALLIKTLPDGEGNLTGDTEIGWHLRRASWGKGYATEAAKAGIRYAFDILKLPELHAVVYSNNAKSIAVTQRLGMQHQGQTDRYYYGVRLEHFLLANA